MANHPHRNPSHSTSSHPSPPTDPPDLDGPGPEEAVFRETFLAQFTGHRDNETARAFGDVLAQLIRFYEASEAEIAESWYFREMRAGAADLRLLEASFRAFQEQRYGNSMDASEHDLCDLGREVAGEIAKIAERIGGAVGPAPAR